MKASVTVRRQKITKNYAKKRLCFFLLLAAALMIVVIFAEHICPFDPNEQAFSPLEPPSAMHPAGTDRLGRDMLSRILVGLQTSVLSTLSLVAIIAVAGTVVGVLCGHLGGAVDSLVMRISDICLALPSLVFALAIAALLNGGLQNAVIALAAVSWPKYARLARSETLRLEGEDYIAAARLAGCSSVQIIWRHILPNIAGPILVTAALDVGTMMMELAALSFLGLGAMPPTAELGNMMSAGRSMLQIHAWAVMGPGIAIFAAVAIFNLLGDATRDYLDPRESCGRRL